MNKDFLVVLLNKDIRELALLTEGFEGMNTLPASILRLALQKAESIVQNLNELGGVQIPATVEKMEEAPAPVVESKQDVSVEEKSEENPEVSYLHAEEPQEEVEDTPDFTENIADYKLPEPVAETRLETETMCQETDVVEEDIQEEKAVEEPEEEPEISHTLPIEDKVPNETVSVDPVSEKTEQEEVLEEDNAAVLNSVNENIKIDDIRTAINIGDRFRFQRELFRGNGEVMNKTLAYLNQLAKYEEALSFLNNKFGWEKDNSHAEDFLQIVRRRFL